MKKIFFILIDICLISLAELLGFYMRLGFQLDEKYLKMYYTNLFLVIIIRILSLFSFNLYERGIKSFITIVNSIFKANLISSLIITSLTYFNRNIGYPRSVIILSFFNTCIILLFKYFIYWRIILFKKGKKRVIIVGEPDKFLIENIISKHWDIIGLIGYNKSKENFVKYLGSIKYIKKIIMKKNPNLILISIPYKKLAERVKVIALCDELKKDYLIIPSFYEIVTGKSKLDEIDDITVLEPRFETIETILNKILKRMFDIIFSLIILILLLPFIFIISVLIKITSPGPVIYKQLRAGQYGKPFYLYKFRTMVPNADKLGSLLTEKNDKRITKFGKFLRRWSLDEIPQFYNVLKGDMSIVGPRPEVIEIVKTYKEWEKRVLKVKPGITGLAQISGRQDLDRNTKLKLDLIYIKNYSFFLDLEIILKTIFAVIKGKGAY